MRGMVGRKKVWIGLLPLLAMACLGSGCISWIFSKPDPFPPAVAEDPKIRPGISLKITLITTGKSEDSTVTVSLNGEITLPLVNTFKCDGMTLSELEEKLKKVHEQFYQNPRVTVHFLFGEGMLSPWGTVNVRGRVCREGPVNIPPTCDLTLTRALQLAGGVSALGNQNKVRITRARKDGKQCSVEVDLEEIGKRGKIEYDYTLQAGDVIWVPEIVW